MLLTTILVPQVLYQILLETAVSCMITNFIVFLKDISKSIDGAFGKPCHLRRNSYCFISGYGKHRNQQAPWLINITILRSGKDVSNTTFHTTSTLLIIDYSLLADTTLTLDTTKYYKLQRTHYLLIQL